MLTMDIHFVQTLLLLAIGFISGKFISTFLIQISVWERVKELGVRPSLSSAILIYCRQTFCGWNTELAPRCLVISLLTSILFITFWARYGISLTLIFCCIYSLFGQVYLFSWLDDKDIPENVTMIFLIMGSISVYFLDENRFSHSLLFSILYFISIYFGFHRNHRISGNTCSNLYGFVFSLVVWFGLIPTLAVMSLSYMAAILIRTQEKIKKVYCNHELLNPIMCVFFFVYSLFKFPSVL